MSRTLDSVVKTIVIVAASVAIGIIGTVSYQNVLNRPQTLPKPPYFSFHTNSIVCFNDDSAYGMKAFISDGNKEVIGKELDLFVIEDPLLIESRDKSRCFWIPDEALKSGRFSLYAVDTTQAKSETETFNVLPDGAVFYRSRK